MASLQLIIIQEPTINDFKLHSQEKGSLQILIYNQAL